MKFLKGNQIIIYVIALMLITAGYLNYTTKNETQPTAQTNVTETNEAQVADIGDAALVNSNDVVTENTASTSTNTTNTEVNETNTIANTQETNAPEAQEDQKRTIDPNDYFANSKIERDKMYSQMIEVYEKVLNSNTSLDAQKQSANEEIQKINNLKNSIMISESLIKTKGFENSVIFANGDSINVVIGTTTLEKEDVAQIQNIIEREMKASPENIHIATK